MSNKDSNMTKIQCNFTHLTLTHTHIIVKVSSRSMQYPNHIFINSLPTGKFHMLLCRLLGMFLKSFFFSQKIFQEYHPSANTFDPDQA